MIHLWRHFCVSTVMSDRYTWPKVTTPFINSSPIFNLKLSNKPSCWCGSFEIFRLRIWARIIELLIHLGSHFASRLSCCHPKLDTKLALISSIFDRYWNQGCKKHRLAKTNLIVHNDTFAGDEMITAVFVFDELTVHELQKCATTSYHGYRNVHTAGKVFDMITPKWSPEFGYGRTLWHQHVVPYSVELCVEIWYLSTYTSLDKMYL